MVQEQTLNNASGDRKDCPIKTVLLNADASSCIEVSEAALDELSRAVTTLQRVKRCQMMAEARKNTVRKAQFESIATSLETAIKALQRNPNKLLFVRRMRRDAEFVLRELNYPILGRLINGFKYVLYESTTPFKVLVGLLMGLPIYLLIPSLPYQQMIVQPVLNPLIDTNKTCIPKENALPALGAMKGIKPSAPETTLKEEQSPTSGARMTQCEVDEAIALLVLVGVAGSLGSIVSILTRIKEYETEKYSDAFLPFYVGAFKPLIGGAFGILIFTMINSGVLPLKLDSGQREIQQWYALYAIAFIAGFSERLVKDIISQAEDKVAGKQATTKVIETPSQNGDSN